MHAKRRPARVGPGQGAGAIEGHRQDSMARRDYRDYQTRRRALLGLIRASVPHVAAICRHELADLEAEARP